MEKQLKHIFTGILNGVPVPYLYGIKKTIPRPCCSIFPAIVVISPFQHVLRNELGHGWDDT
jgi:hypothetical protein